MKAISCLPAATHIVQELGLGHLLSAVTFECPIDRPRVVRSYLEDQSLSSSEIDKIVTEYSKAGKSLYYIDKELLLQIQPDIVLTQDVCGVCQVPTSYVLQSLEILPKAPKVVSLVPRRLEDIFSNVLEVSKVLNAPEAGERLVGSCKERIKSVAEKLHACQSKIVETFIMEWVDPLYNCGHWIPDVLSLAGGLDALGNPGGYSVAISWERLLQYDPEVIIIAPCGFGPDRAMQDIVKLEEKEGWGSLKAVKARRVFVIHADLFTRPSTSVIDGMEILAALLHPDVFGDFKINPEICRTVYSG